MHRLYQLLIISAVIGVSLCKSSAQSAQEIETLFQKSDSFIYDDPDKSLEFAERAIELSIQLRNDSTLAEARFRKGSALWTKGDLGDALYQLEKATLLIKNNENQLLLALINKRIGTLYSAIGDQSSSIFYCKKALKSFESLQNNFEAAGAYNNLGRAFRVMGQYDSAITFLTKGLTLVTSSKSRINCMLHYNLGRNYLKMNQLDLAQKHLETTVKLSEELNHHQGILRSKSVLLKLFLQKGELARAQKLSAEIDELAFQVNSKDLYSLIYGIKSEISFAMDDLPNAYRNLRLANIYKDSIQSDKNKSMLKVYQVKITNEQLDFLKKENAIKELETINSRTTTQAIGIVAFMAIVLAGVFYHNRTVSIQANKVLGEKNEKINQQRRELEDLNDFKSRLIAIVSHDLRSPIQGLMGILDLLDKQLVDSKDLEKVIPQIKLRIKRNSDKINDLLSWSSQDIGKSSVDSLVFSLEECVHGILDDLAMESANKKITILRELESNVEIRTNEKILNTVIRNLILNAIKFSREHDKILVKTFLKDNCTLISIKDWGIGMSKQKMGVLFETRNEPTKGTKNEIGSGMGLIICKDLVHIIGGEIWVESEVDVGSEFFISIPNTNEVND